jgi:hypothetical protein
LNKVILGFDISKERDMFVAEKFIKDLTKAYDRHPFQQALAHGILNLVDFYIKMPSPFLIREKYY